MEAHKVDFIPLKVIVLYILLGVSLSFWGPIEFMDYDKLPVGTYMMSFLLLFTIGYILGLIEINKSIKSINYEYQNNNLQKVLFWVKISIIIIALVQFINLTLSIADGTLNLSVSNMGQAYIDGYKDYERGTGNISMTFLVQTLTYIPYLVTLILGAFYFKELPKTYKTLVVFSYLSIILLETIGHGKQKQLGDIFIFLIIILVLKSDITNPKARKNIFRKIFIFALMGISSLMSVLYFRYAALGIDALNINSKIHALMEMDTNHPIFTIFGDELGFPITIFTSYLSQGYYGLSLSLQEPFEWTYFMGNSYSLTVFMQRFLGVPVDFHDTYPYRVAIHTGWEDNKWSTVFAWFAGDFTFVGTLLLFALIAFLYAKVWREAYRYQNPISIILFANLTIGLLYIPANNQLLHTPGSFIAIFYFIIIWIFKHKKFNFYKTIV